MTVVERPGTARDGTRPGDGMPAARDDVPPGGLRITTVPAPAVDPIGLFAAAREQDLEAALWLQPSAGFALVGIGRAWSVEAGGATRFGRSAAAWQERLATAVIDTPAGSPRGAGPVLLGGLGFTGEWPGSDDPWGPFGPSSLVLPELTFAHAHGATFRTTVAAIPAAGRAADPGDLDARARDRRWDALVARAGALSPGAGGVIARPADQMLVLVGERPDRVAWDRLVGLFAGAVGRGRLDKVVLARRVQLQSSIDIDVENALRRLAAGAPEGTIYAFVRGGRTFLGATPERLVRSAGRDFETVAIAGSAPRGTTPAEDAALARALVASEKEREEHAVVVEMLRESLAPLAERLDVGGTPGILHGSRSYMLQDADGQVIEAVSISAGLDYPGIGPQLAALMQAGRLVVSSATDVEAVEAVWQVARTEGILAAVESAHAVAALPDVLARTAAEASAGRAEALPREAVVVLGLSGRGDKDLAALGLREVGR